MKGSRIRFVLWLFLFGFVLHEFEEWNLVEWQTRSFHPDPGFTTHQSRVLLVSLAVMGVGFAAPCIHFLEERTAVRILVPLFVAPIVANAFTHVLWTILFAGYAPGVATSVLVLLPAGLYLLWRSYVDRHLPGLVVVLLSLFVLGPSMGAISAGEKLSPTQVELQRAGGRVADWLKPQAR